MWFNTKWVKRELEMHRAALRLLLNEKYIDKQMETIEDGKLIRFTVKRVMFVGVDLCVFSDKNIMIGKMYKLKNCVPCVE